VEINFQLRPQLRTANCELFCHVVLELIKQWLASEAPSSQDQ